MRVPRKLGEESESHPHSNVAKRLRVGILSADARRLITIHLKMSMRPEFELAFSLYRFGVGGHGESIPLRGKLRLINRTLTRNGAVLTRIERFHLFCLLTCHKNADEKMHYAYTGSERETQQHSRFLAYKGAIL